MFLELIPPSVNTAREQSGLQSVETRLFWNSLQSPGLFSLQHQSKPIMAAYHFPPHSTEREHP